MEFLSHGGDLRDEEVPQMAPLMYLPSYSQIVPSPQSLQQCTPYLRALHPPVLHLLTAAEVAFSGTRVMGRLTG